MDFHAGMRFRQLVFSSCIFDIFGIVKTMKKLLASALIVASSSTIAAGMDDVNFNILAGYDRNAPTVAFEVDYANILLGTQLHAEQNSNVADLTSKNAIALGTVERNNFSFYSGYRFDMGLSLKAGVTFNSLKFDHVASEIGSFSNRKVLPFLGAGYEFKNGLNLNLHGTIAKMTN
ncbi:hypothetical protein COR52_08480 [Vibrio mediterranei]|uniref:Outer membrane protein beta-barrel domain-containing protein n=2 Tax=Vibrio mediterranei TaxID=689 RepID=A0ABX5DG99_9VIBR|nr:hypothetical protein COR52_08480 [Vibrio mediterranei]PRQ68729.1 hypothetical protein COR51_04810 [Vibrio mediterranei]